jgi:RHS repeat-associated protein
VAAITDDEGRLLDQQRHEARPSSGAPGRFGAERPNVGTIAQTDFGYTGQPLRPAAQGRAMAAGCRLARRDLAGMGLMDYKARMYDSAIGRFIQPDSIIPNPADPQSWNRFSYVRNSPIMLVDPTGHWQDEGCGSGKLRELENADPKEKKAKEPPPDKYGGEPAINGCWVTDYDCLVWEQINQQFDPFAPYFGGNGGAPPYDVMENNRLVLEAYKLEHYDLWTLGARGLDNPLTVEQFANHGVDIEWVEFANPSRRTSGQAIFMDTMRLNPDWTTNYEPNFLNAVMQTHPGEVSSSKQDYYDRLIAINGDAQAAYGWLLISKELIGTE